MQWRRHGGIYVQTPPEISANPLIKIVILGGPMYVYHLIVCFSHVVCLSFVFMGEKLWLLTLILTQH